MRIPTKRKKRGQDSIMCVHRMGEIRACLPVCTTCLMIVVLVGFALTQQAIPRSSKPVTIHGQTKHESLEMLGKRELTESGFAKIRALASHLTQANHDSAHPSPIDFGSGSAEVSYVIVKDDEGLVSARNGTTGEVEFNGTDASTVIQSAIDTLTNAGRILIKSGTYSLTKALVDSNVKGIAVQGEGTSTVLSIDADVNGFALSLTSDWVISNLKIKGNRPSRSLGHGINLVKCENIHISNIEIDGAKDCGINLWHCNHCRIEDFYFHDVGLGGIFLNTNVDTLIQNGRIEDVSLDRFPNGPCGIEIFAESAHSGKNVVSNVYFYRTRCEAVGIWNEDDNKIYSCVSVEAGYGVDVGNQAFILNSQADRNILANNLAISSMGIGGVGFYVFGSAENLLIGNVAFSNDGYGIWIDAGEGQNADRNRIIGNVFIYNGKYGGRIDEGNSNEWVDNMFYGNEYGPFHLVGGADHIFSDNLGLSY